MEHAGEDNILCREKLTKNGNQAPTKEKQAQIEQTKEMWFLLISDQKRYSLLLNQLRYEGVNLQ